VSVRPSVLNDNVLPLHVAVLAKALTERIDVGCGRRLGPYVTYPRDLARLLRLGCERRRKENRTRACKERATVYHSMT
jgi:hypothetical protein